METATWTEPTATDNSGMVTLTSDYISGGSFPVGTTTVTYTATDESGNTAECDFDVIVAGKNTMINEFNISTVGYVFPASKSLLLQYSYIF